MRQLRISLLALFALLFGISGISFGATAAFIGTDTTTHGNWQGTYGNVGYYIPNGPSQIPSDGSTFNPGAALLYTWDSNVASTGALKTTSGNIASAWYNNSGTSLPSLTLDVVVPSEQSQTVALYVLDYDQQGRAESVSVTDTSGNSLAAPISVSGTNFTAGEYLLWTITGEVHIAITRIGGPNAVATGIFFGQNTIMPPPVNASAYITRFHGTTINAVSTQTAKLTLTPGTYLIHVDVTMIQLGSVSTLNASCFLYHTSFSNTSYIDGAQTNPDSLELFVPTTPDSGFNLAGATTSQTTAITLTTPDSVLLYCGDASGSGSQVHATGTLTATTLQSVIVQ